MADPNMSNRRAFYCQETLWQAFSDLAMKRGCTVDTLINEAMAAYVQSNSAEQIGYGRQPMTPPSAPAAPQAPARAPVQPFGRQPAPIASPGFANAQPIPPAPLTAPPQGGRVPPPTPNSPYRRPPSIFEEPVSEAASNGQPMVLASLNQPQQPAMPPRQQYPQQPAMAQQTGAQPPLYIIFANQRYTVDKDKYIIGRSSQLADLVIRDGNISRKHCAIIFKNGAYYIKDLDSTNGIEYKGSRIDTKRIDEGDQFNICEFHFTFTYR
ncbi:MAG: FHA domain-containing protein [Proteobacteria bacterium]|nr:FHA domain-containing protein [Pseudomonadota bacterium]